MANIKIATITNHVRIDQVYLDAAAAAGDVLQIEVVNSYINATPQLAVYGDIPTAYKTAMKEAIDYTTYLNEDPALVFHVAFDGTTHTMTGYDRTGIPSTGTAIDENDVLIAVFQIAWLNGKADRLELPLTLKEGVALDTTEVSDLADKGITVSGNGQSFTISNDTPYLLQCVRPPGETQTYIINHSYDINTIRS
jgi:hypothetical protein